MTRRRIVIASPIEPSGASWILNCLLELGVQVHHRPVERNVFPNGGSMWLEGRDGPTLHPRAAVLAKWMPALGRAEPHRFRPDVEIDYVQDLPSRGDASGPSLLFVRDPRDAIFSAYQRLQPEIGFDEFVDLPNPRSLLDRGAHWALFIWSWLARAGVMAFRFEDYKRDDRATLLAALDHLELDFQEADITRALAASTFEQAREAEARYRRRHPGDGEVANRAGRVGDFRGRPELGAALPRIEARTADLLERLGYEGGQTAEIAPRGFGLARVLAAYRTVALPPDVAAAADARDPLTDPALEELLTLARRIRPESLARARMPAHDARALLDSLAELSEACDGLVRGRLVAARDAFSDASAYHGRQLGALLRSRRGAARA